MTSRLEFYLQEYDQAKELLEDSKATAELEYWHDRLIAATDELARCIIICDCLNTGPDGQTLYWLGKMSKPALENFSLGQAIIGAHTNGSLYDVSKILFNKVMFRQMAEKETK